MPRKFATKDPEVASARSWISNGVRWGNPEMEREGRRRLKRANARLLMAQATQLLAEADANDHADEKS
jgi:hypothetical protein